jgi:glutamate dehydrogenase/leucine dehydrogenase
MDLMQDFQHKLKTGTVSNSLAEIIAVLYPAALENSITADNAESIKQK